MIRAPGQRAGLTQEAVVAAARVVADREGVERLSMRSLAAELEVAPNALYSHVEDKNDLIDLLIDGLLGEIEAPGGDWRKALLDVMDQSRRMLVAHPALIPEFLARPTRGPNALRLGEVSIGLLARGGVEGELAVQAFRALLVYSLGFAAYEAPRLRDPDREGRVRQSTDFFGGSSDGRVREVAAELAELPGDGEFRTGIEWLLDGVLAGRQAK